MELGRRQGGTPQPIVELQVSLRDRVSKVHRGTGRPARSGPDVSFFSRGVGTCECCSFTFRTRRKNSETGNIGTRGLVAWEGGGSVHVPRTREDRASEQPGGEGSLASSAITATGTSTETTEGAQDELRRRSQRGHCPTTLSPQPRSRQQLSSRSRPRPTAPPFSARAVPGRAAPEQIPPPLHTHLANPLTAVPETHNSAGPRA